MLAACARIGDVGCGDFIGPQIEAVSDHDLLDLAARERSNFNKIGIDRMAIGNDERAAMGRAVGRSEGCGRDIHLSVAHENVAVAAKAPEALVLVNVGAVSVEKTAVTQDEIKDGTAPEHVIDLQPVMLAAWSLRIAVVIGLAARTGQPLEFETLRRYRIRLL